MKIQGTSKEPSEIYLVFIILPVEKVTIHRSGVTFRGQSSNKEGINTTLHSFIMGMRLAQNVLKGSIFIMLLLNN